MIRLEVPRATGAEEGTRSASRTYRQQPATSDLLIAVHIGLSLPVIEARVALDLGAGAPNIALGFAILLGLGVVASG